MRSCCAGTDSKAPERRRQPYANPPAQARAALRFRQFSPAQIIDGKGAIMTNTYKDPVCGMDVTPESAAGKAEYQGRTYYFCSLGCRDSFEEQPEKYLAEAATSHAHSCC
jgi:Cu+-exporting ATPase